MFFQFRMEIIHRTRRNADAMRIQKLCLVILRQLSILDPDCSLSLSTCDPLLAHCFRLLKSSTLTETACDLIEHLLLSRNDLVQLDGFSKSFIRKQCWRLPRYHSQFYFTERFNDVLQQLDDETLSQTYRVLSLAVSDVDECENRASRNETDLLYNFRIEKSNNIFCLQSSSPASPKAKHTHQRDDRVEFKSRFRCCHTRSSWESLELRLQFALYAQFSVTFFESELDSISLYVFFSCSRSPLPPAQHGKRAVDGLDR